MQTELRFLRPVTKTEEHRFQKMKNFIAMSSRIDFIMMHIKL